MRFSLRRMFQRSGRPMNCRQVGKLLQQYLDGVLDDERSAALAEHLDECLRCGLEAETYERVKQSLAERSLAVPADSLMRLEEFAERLARGDESALS